MNKFSVAKLKLSKWTAVSPVDKEKHFLVTAINCDTDGRIESCVIEAVHSGRERVIDYRDLRDSDTWRMGWK